MINFKVFNGKTIAKLNLVLVILTLMFSSFHSNAQGFLINFEMFGEQPSEYSEYYGSSVNPGSVFIDIDKENSMLYVSVPNDTITFDKKITGRGDAIPNICHEELATQYLYSKFSESESEYVIIYYNDIPLEFIFPFGNNNYRLSNPTKITYYSQSPKLLNGRFVFEPNEKEFSKVIYNTQLD
jgi:hypothetical protein